MKIAEVYEKDLENKRSNRNFLLFQMISLEEERHQILMSFPVVEHTPPKYVFLRIFDNLWRDGIILLEGRSS